MSNKKDLRVGTDALLGERRVQELEATLDPKTREDLAETREAIKKGPGRPKKEFVDDTFFRTTIIAHRVNYEKIKVIAMKEGMSFKDVLNEAISAAVEKYEEKHGEVILRDNREKLFK